MPRIKVGSRVTTEAWRFDKDKKKRWSEEVFKDGWKNARVNGTVVMKSGTHHWNILWDIDGSESSLPTDVLQHECSDLPTQVRFYGNSGANVATVNAGNGGAVGGAVNAGNGDGIAHGEKDQGMMVS